MKVKIKISLPYYQEICGGDYSGDHHLCNELMRVRREFSPVPLVEGELTPHWDGDDIDKALTILLQSKDNYAQVQVTIGGIIQYIPVGEIKEITIVH